ncbi:MAG: hypothetical protein ACPGRW_09310 [Flavobacteriaceae bacterium]
MTDKNQDNNKYKKLVLGLILDVIGMVSFTLPLIGEFGDVIWAPFSAFILSKMYKGTTGKVAGIVGFIEEISPGLDVIPTFTLTWIYEYLLKDKLNKKDIIKTH